MEINIGTTYELILEIVDQGILVENEDDLYSDITISNIENPQIKVAGRMVKPLLDLWSLILDKTAVVSTEPSIQTNDLRFEDLGDFDSINPKDRIRFWAQYCIDGNLKGKTFYIVVEASVLSIEEI